MKRGFIITILVLMIGIPVRAQGRDAARAAAIRLWSSQSQKTLKAQERMQLLMAAGHIWINEEEEVLNDFHKQFNQYLDDFHDVIQIAAEVYGIYNEVSAVAQNIKNLSEVVAHSPSNVLATAFSARRNKVYQNIIKTGIDMVDDLRQVEYSKMTEKERASLVRNIRSKLRHINKQLRQLTLVINYTSFMDVWKEIQGVSFHYQKRTRKEIAEQAIRDWKDNCRITH